MAAAQAIHIAHDDVGSGHPAVVLLHGLFEDRTYYAAQVQHLRATHRVINIDLRGHGQSDVPEDGYTIDALADDVIEVCEGAGVSSAVFCGHSFAVALRVAVRRPDLAAGVVLLDGVVLMPDAERERMMGFTQVLETDGWRQALLGFFGGVAAGAVERVRSDIAVVPRVYAAPLLREIASSDNADELIAARCPLLYVHSGMPMDLERLRALRPDAMVESIPHAGHYLMLTAPEAVNAALDRFLATIPVDSPAQPR
jgi:pimeloyl-ACP methyl ester carboxylesterase